MIFKKDKEAIASLLSRIEKLEGALDQQVKINQDMTTALFLMEETIVSHQQSIVDLEQAYTTMINDLYGTGTTDLEFKPFVDGSNKTPPDKKEMN